MLYRFKTCVLIHSLNLVMITLSFVVMSPANAVNVADVASGVTTAQMEAALTGSGVTISNLTVTNPGNCVNFNQGVGVFTNGATPVGPGPILGEPTGVIVANNAFANAANALNTSNDTANTTNLLCNGTTSDPDMVAIEPGTVNGEYAAIEFDVVPVSTTLAIPFQFGSDEFPEYVCSNFGDLVGIFVSGPGISGPYSGALNAQNYAKTSAGDLSSINWVNTGAVGISGNIANCGSLANAAFYSDNSNGNTTGGNATVATTNANLELDGFTNTLFQPVPVVAGSSYHVKIAVADSADRTYDSTAFIHPLFSTSSFSGFDYGDAPNSYGTLTSNAGPSHGIDSSIFMGGGAPDNEITGLPAVNADGDDLDLSDDEDGIVSIPILLSNASTYSVNVNVTNNSGNIATLVGWIDFNGNGTFESDEGTQTSVINGTTGASIALNWPSLTGLVAGETYMRIRFSSDPGLSIFNPGSSMSDGEVEDYPTSISTVTFDEYISTDPGCTDKLKTLSVASGMSVYYCYTVSNPNASAFTVSASTNDLGFDLSALHIPYAPTATQTVIIGPMITGTAALPVGVTVNNTMLTATISGMPVSVNDSVSLTVSLNPPASGMKQLYFDAVDTATPDLTRDPVNFLVNTRSANIASGATITLNQGIVFQAPFTMSGGNNVNTQLILRRRGGGGARTAQIELFHGVSGALIGTGSVTWNANGWQTLQMPVAIAADEYFLANDYIRVVLTNTGTNNIQLSTINGAVKSQIQIQSSTVINIDAIDIYAAPYPSVLKFSSYKPGDSVYIRAMVSDPFGNVDITGAVITIDDPASPPSQITDAIMASVATPTTATRLFEYSYVVPAAPVGFWSLSITANEGAESTVSHTSLSTMIIGIPGISISKTSTVLSDPINLSNFKAIPSAIIEYTVNVENANYGFVDRDTFVLSDPVAAGTTFFFGSPLNPVDFVDGATSSGLTFNFIDLASTIDDIAFSNDGGASFITPGVDASGFDITSPPVNFIQISPKGEFNGGDTINNPAMELKFRVKVD